ncbi:CDK-activating kinase assembly factor MAT1-domain-containing protein [Phyllosticta citriasiana]|uniref:CDK-activating kinase assembly factor MAT1-domain-containing protein n=1 Tax=Phyllosticta citriasiana TaxID=595635 RepID=UPI0030FDB8DF
MSRAARRESGAIAVKGPVEDGGELQLFHAHFSSLRLQEALAVDDEASPANQFVDDIDICPVCKSSRYLNPHMRFLINPECYHQMCESCVDRIYSHGPAPCRVAGCSKTLRKNRFRKKTFEDVEIEREVDIRRRVAAVFNRREDEFESIQDYNNYLNDVEDVTYDLIHRVNIEAAEAKLRQYAESNAASIKENKSLAEEEANAWEAAQAEEKEQARLRREAAVREDEELARERLEGRRDVLNQLASGQGDAKKITQTHLKRANQTRASGSTPMLPSSSSRVSAKAPAPSNGAPSASGFQIKGLKKRLPKEPEKPFDPFDGDTDARKYTVPKERYDWDYLDSFAKAVPAAVAGGYDFREYYSRALCDAFAGFTVFVQDELAATYSSTEAPQVVTKAAAVAGVGVAKADVNMDDVF